MHSVYLTSFVVGKYVKFSDSYKNILLSVCLYPGREKYYEQIFGKTKEMLRIFEELTGVAYPFNKYHQTIVARFRLGGMENITATTLSDRDIFFSDRNRLRRRYYLARGRSFLVRQSRHLPKLG